MVTGTVLGQCALQYVLQEIGTPDAIGKFRPCSSKNHEPRF
jgi:hypothetical protein